MAVREFTLEHDHGRVDYLLFVDGQPAGVIEAKPEGTTLVEVDARFGVHCHVAGPGMGGPCRRRAAGSRWETWRATASGLGRA
jgi:hypothetical protein